jgi:hypothetical protein
MCPCKILQEAATRQFNPIVLGELEKTFMKMNAEVRCDKEGRSMDTARMNEAFQAGCASHSALKRRLRRDPALRGTDLEKRKNNFDWNNKDKDGLEWFLKWKDASDEDCALKCDDVFNLMVTSDKCKYNRT